VTIVDRLAAFGPAARIGLGLAAVGRPGYINLGRDADLPSDRSVAALRSRTHELLDAAYADGVRYVDVARSYGRAEEFVAEWRRPPRDVVVGSKWGYAYTAGWRVDAEVHEVKDHSLDVFARQLGESRALLGAGLDVYHVHSVTPQSPALTDVRLHRRLAALTAEGVTVGISTSGPAQPAAIRAALAVTVDGVPLFRSVQATWNPLEPSAGPALAEAHTAGALVIVKEAMANGRLAGREPGPALDLLTAIAERTGSTPDAVALAAALHQAWATVVLSGAATVAQLRTNLAARTTVLSPEDVAALAGLREAPEAYWRYRGTLAWS
jgi:aryl-alcohol dehydrogenase-like predicted oxidoreductase